MPTAPALAPTSVVPGASRAPIALHLALACALTWAIWIPLVLSRRGVLPFDLPPALYFVGALGPALAAAIIVARREGHGGLRAWLGPLFRWRAHPGWYVAALALPALGGLIASGAAAVLAPAETTLEFNAVTAIVPSFFTLLLLLPGEELGWRGFALPRLTAQQSPVRASIWIGIAWATWHLPAFWFSGVFETTGAVLMAFGMFLPFAIAASVVFTWITRGSGGSVLLATIHHASFAFAAVTNAATQATGVYFTTLVVLWIGLALAISRTRVMQTASR